MENRFVSEKDLEAARKQRQEDWDKVRRPDQPEKPPEAEAEPYDPRSLYDRLQEQVTRKQDEIEESKKFKNQLRGLDEEEVKFLENVESARAQKERQQRMEEKQLLDEVKRESALLAARSCSAAVEEGGPRKVVPPAGAGGGGSRQKEMLKGIVVRKRGASCEEILPPKMAKTETTEGAPASAPASVGVYPSALCLAGVRPSVLLAYGEDGDDSRCSSSTTTSESSEEVEDTSFPVSRVVHGGRAREEEEGEEG